MTQHQTLTSVTDNGRAVLDFIHDAGAATVPGDVRQTTALYLLDCVGVLAAAGLLDAGRIARGHAVAHWAAGPGAPVARILFDGRAASVPGAAFAMATQLDNLDAHDGWQASKGHAGAALVPALAAVAQIGADISGPEALAVLAMGYEVSNYAASALHETVADYHTSGAWNALGCAAIAARLLGLERGVTRHALGIAEYHAPRSQMMREIANPTMLHDGSGFGAPVGVGAALMAQDGFLGAPAATVEFDDASPHWAGLGQVWRVIDQYIKPYPICRWAHAPIDGALILRQAHRLTPDQIDRVEIVSFDYAAALTCEVPKSPHEAQYSMAWPVACALVRGKVGVEEILPAALADPDLAAMTDRITASAHADFERDYPQTRRGQVTIHCTDGRELTTGPLVASGGPYPQPTLAEVVTKFRAFAGAVMDGSRVAEIENAALGLTEDGTSFQAFLDRLFAP